MFQIRLVESMFKQCLFEKTSLLKLLLLLLPLLLFLSALCLSRRLSEVWASINTDTDTHTPAKLKLGLKCVCVCDH